MRLSPPYHADKEIARIIRKIYDDMNRLASLIDQSGERGNVRDSDEPGKIGVERNGKDYNIVVNTKDGKVRGDGLLKKE